MSGPPGPGIYIAVGIAVGILIGVVMNNGALGIAIGILLGISFYGVSRAISRRRRN